VTTESAFQAALDAEPDNHALRGAFSDWLEERGDWRAAGYRWMSGNEKFANGSLVDGPYWSGITLEIGEEGDRDDVPYNQRRLPKEIHAALHRGIEPFPCHYRQYPTRQAAEEALCRALHEHPELLTGAAA